MALPLIAAIPPIIKWIIGAYILTIATVVVVTYTSLTVVIIQDWNNKEAMASLGGLKPGLYSNWAELRYNENRPFHLHPPSFENYHYLDKIRQRFKESHWYHELDTNKSYSLSLEKIQYEIPEKIYRTEPFTCEQKSCQVTSKFHIDQIELPSGYESGIIELFELPDNYVIPFDIQFNYTMTESEQLSYWFLPIMINTKLTKRYRDDHKISHSTNFTMVIPYQQTRVGFYSSDIESTS